jgi:predicted dehydrogenase
MVSDGGTLYDRLCYITVKSEEGLVGDVIQDVVTSPAEKSCRIQGRDGFVDWRVNAKPGHDSVVTGSGDAVEESFIAKTRADDFKAEIAHLEQVMAGTVQSSPIAITRGLDTMMVIAAAFKSHETGRRVRIDWRKGYTPEALI